MKKIILAGAVTIALLVLGFLYFFHVSVKINSDYDISDVSVIEENKNETKESDRNFSHLAFSGVYTYRFIVKNGQDEVPVNVQVAKKSSFSHDNVSISVTNSDPNNKSIITVDVYKDDVFANGGTFDVAKDGRIVVKVD